MSSQELSLQTELTKDFSDRLSMKKKLVESVVNSVGIVHQRIFVFNVK